MVAAMARRDHKVVNFGVGEKVSQKSTPLI